MQENQLQPWRKGRFTTDAMFELSGGESFVGWTRGYDWNGWATPYFESHEAGRLMLMQARLGLAKFKLDDGKVWVAENDGSDTWEFYECKWVEGPDGVRVLPLGCMEWCWEEVESA